MKVASGRGGEGATVLQRVDSPGVVIIAIIIIQRSPSVSILSRHNDNNVYVTASPQFPRVLMKAILESTVIAGIKPG